MLTYYIHVQLIYSLLPSFQCGSYIKSDCSQAAIKVDGSDPNVVTSELLDDLIQADVTKRYNSACYNQTRGMGGKKRKLRGIYFTNNMHILY